MIRYSLVCAKDHSFESWFQSADAFDTLSEAGHVNCSVCGSSDVRKTIMAPRLGKSANDTEDRPLSSPSTPAEQALREIRRKIEETAENVGRNFAREARAIHSGDAPDRPIYGEANLQDAKLMIEDGLPVVPLPFLPNRKTN